MKIGEGDCDARPLGDDEGGGPRCGVDGSILFVKGPGVIAAQGACLFGEGNSATELFCCGKNHPQPWFD